jgi:hypothetical protein
MTITECERKLGIVPPYTEDDLKRCYRQLAFKYHPDINKNKDAENRMKELNLAYKFLSDNGNFTVEMSESSFATDKPFDSNDPFAIWEQHKACNGKGVIPHYEGYKDFCPDCADYKNLWFFPHLSKGYILDTCSACNGTGKFILRNKREVICKRCDGRGKVKKVCLTCNGKGFVYEPSRVVTTRCICNGGWVKRVTWNPVITPSAILNSQQGLSQKEKRRRGLI